MVPLRRGGGRRGLDVEGTFSAPPKVNAWGSEPVDILFGHECAVAFGGENGEPGPTRVRLCNVNELVQKWAQIGGR